MRFVLAAFLVLTANVLKDSSSEAADKIRPITKADTILAIYSEDSGRYSWGIPKLIFAVWGDGEVVWSEDRIHGGPPYRSGHIKREKVTSMMARLEKDGFFENPKLNRAYYTIHSEYIAITIKSGKKQFVMASEHEYLEEERADTKALKGSRRLDVLAKRDVDYLLFRLAWLEIRGLAYSLVPDKSTPHKGKVAMKAGIMSWRLLEK